MNAQQLFELTDLLSNLPEMQQVCFVRCLRIYLDTHPDVTVGMLNAIGDLANWSDSVMDSLALERA